MHIPTGVRAVLAAVGTLAALGVIVGGYLFLHQGAGARQPVPVDLPGVPVAELASRGFALTAPPTDLRGTVSQDVVYLGAPLTYSLAHDRAKGRAGRCRADHRFRPGTGRHRRAAGRLVPLLGLRAWR